MSKVEARKKRRADLAHEWWASVREDRGICARLRRAPDIDAIALEAATRDLHRRFGGELPSYLRTALVAGVLAGVRFDAPRAGFAEALGVPKTGGGTPVMSALRAERLRRARTPEEALDPFRRAVALLGDGRADVRDLACYLIDWCDERLAVGPLADGRRSFADMARIRFAFAYRGAASAAPGADGATQPEEAVS